MDVHKVRATLNSQNTYFKWTIVPGGRFGANGDQIPSSESRRGCLGASEFYHLSLDDSNCSYMVKSSFVFAACLARSTYTLWSLSDTSLQRGNRKKGTLLLWQELEGGKYVGRQWSQMTCRFNICLPQENSQPDLASSVEWLPYTQRIPWEEVKSELPKSALSRNWLVDFLVISGK